MKKMLVPFDEKTPQKNINDFIYPEISESEVTFLGIKKGRKWSKGMVVFTGVEITANEIFKKITDSGKQIISTNDTIEILQKYVSQLSEFSIGNIVEIEKDDIGGFRLKKFSERPPKEISKIP